MRFLTNLFIALSVLVLALTGCTDQPSGNPSASPDIELTERVTLLMGGHHHAKAITQTGKATAFRIKLDQEQNYEEVVISDGIELTPDQRKVLVELLARDDAYAWDIAKGCEPMPGVLVTFEDGATYARLRICFSCQMLGYKPGSWEDFDPINAELVKWVKGVFPDDELIQKLGTKDEEHGL